ncbi:MAG: PhnB protein [Candidatus Parcubacteria bacterium]|jgi:PhnB protein|nr:PhnB protein [Candidatus Parcubacteria bacterium]
MAKLNPFVKFNDSKCREGMNFYKDCLGGELDFMPVKDSPMAKDMPADKHSLIMHSTLKKGSWTLIGSDMMRDKAIIGDNVGVALECESDDEIKTIFGKLSKGGEVFMPLEEMFWGGVFGLVTDKYGVEWMLNFQMKPMKK